MRRERAKLLQSAQPHLCGGVLDFDDVLDVCPFCDDDDQDCD
jgi:hypothetical protein